MNVVSIKKSNIELIEILEELLVQAKSGKLLAFVASAREIKGITTNIFAGELPAYETLGAIEILKTDFISDYIDIN